MMREFPYYISKYVRAIIHSPCKHNYYSIQRITKIYVYVYWYNCLFSVLGPISRTRLFDSYLHLVVKDRGVVPGSGGVFLGEALIALSDLRVAGDDEELEDAPQRQIPLSRPTDQGN